ncbi:MAG: ATP-binding protein [Saprospiraceae bacterium]|nr:ATP-binding protein [Saprospiraceae bacterium]MBK9630423.1 ATP-binding protein [Saprospiraceae bacterium]
MIAKRNIEDRLKAMAAKFPIVSVTGPRQSGKTTLLRSLFPDYRYISLENPDIQDFALQDPRRFLENYNEFVILDEVQRVPHLFNYLQQKVDDDRIPGQFLLSGSQNYLLMERITQSLAGRVALFKLFPFSYRELRKATWMPDTLEEAIYKGFFPRIYNSEISPIDYYPNYFETYLQRDVRQLSAVQDLVLFRNFVRLCAGRIGQPLNYQSLANDAGISPPTAKAWIGVLEASHICYLLPPYFRNYSKRLSKSPKFYFTDTGLVANLLGISSPQDIQTHFARGQLFENLIVTEILKQKYEQEWNPQLYYWKESNGHEIDLISETIGGYTIAEIKSASTLNNSFFNNLQFFQKHSDSDLKLKAWLIYGGMESQQRGFATVRSWNNLEGIF